MNPVLAAIEKRVVELVNEGAEIYTSAKGVSVDAEFMRRYHAWFASCLAIVESNMPSRREELVALHEGKKKPKNRLDHGVIQGFQSIVPDPFDMTVMTKSILQIRALIGSVPEYLRSRLYDLELEIAQEYVRDELQEAQALLKARYPRAAGALAGVLLERHLKRLCDHASPPVKYTVKDGISKLNDALKAANVYDPAQWRKIQWMGDIRNQCDHANTVEPREADIEDLIAEVKKFLSLFVA